MALCPTCRTVIPCHCHLTPPAQIRPGVYASTEETTVTDQPTRALTIRQPRAGAIAHQTKRVENRSWKLPAKHEGARILIHAGAQPDRHAQVYGDHLDVYSAVVAVATLTGCHWSDEWQCCGYWAFEKAYHWTLADVIALDEPVPAKGRLGIWTPDDELIAAVTSQLTAARSAAV